MFFVGFNGVSASEGILYVSSDGYNFIVQMESCSFTNWTICPKIKSTFLETDKKILRTTETKNQSPYSMTYIWTLKFCCP